MTDDKTHWNYRVVKKKYMIPSHMRKVAGEDFEYVYEIREFYYHEDGRIKAWSEDPIEPKGNDEKDLLGSMILMMNAFRKPILELDEDDEIVHR